MCDCGDVVSEYAGQLLTKFELADHLRVSHWTVDKLIEAGAFPAIRFSATAVRYHLDDLKAYIAENKALSNPNTYGLNEHHELEQGIRRAMGTRFPEGTQLLTSKEAASWLGVSIWSINNWSKAGHLPRVVLRPIRSVRFDAWDVQELIEVRRPARRGIWEEQPLEPKAVLRGSSGSGGSGFPVEASL